MKRGPLTYAWLGILLVLVASAVALAQRLAGMSSPLLSLITPPITWAVAWAAWWPILRPKTGFWLHAAIGLVGSGVGLAILVILRGRPLT